MPDENLPAAIPADVDATLSYWEESPRSYSAQIFARLQAKGPVDQILPIKTTPAARIGMARVALAACDEKISDCEVRIRELQRERDLSMMNRMATLINTRLIAPAPPTQTSEAPALTPEELKKKQEEQENLFFQKWFLNYLTLRNILAFLIIFVGLVGSVIAFTIKVAQDRSKDMTEEITDLKRQKGDAETNLKGAQLKLTSECAPQLATKTGELASKTGELKAANDQLAQVNANAVQLQKNLSAAQAATARAEEQANTARQEAAVLRQKVADLQTPPAPAKK